MSNHHSPSDWEVGSLVDYALHGGCQAGIDIGGVVEWVPARPMKNLDTLPERLRLAWAVFTGRADALFWPGQ